MICPICKKENDDNWPVHIYDEIKTGGCQVCWEKECAESWHEMVENAGWMSLITERDHYKNLHTLAVEGFRAAEYNHQVHRNSFYSIEDRVKANDEWQQSIVAYEAAVKGEGE